MSYSIQVLMKELKSLEKAKNKSVESYKDGSLDFNTHAEHIKNIAPKINQLRRDIYFLEKEVVSRGWFVETLSKN